MIIAAFARRLRPGVSVDDFVRAWAPDDGRPYPAGVEVGIDPADDRRVLTIIRFDGSPQQFQDAMPTLIHPESHRRLDELVESTELESVYESVPVVV